MLERGYNVAHHVTFQINCIEKGDTTARPKRYTKTGTLVDIWFAHDRSMDDIFEYTYQCIEHHVS